MINYYVKMCAITFVVTCMGTNSESRSKSYPHQLVHLGHSLVNYVLLAKAFLGELTLLSFQTVFFLR